MKRSLAKYVLASAIALPVAVIPVGCAHQVNAPAVTPIQKASIIYNDITSTVQVAQQAEATAAHLGQIDHDTHQTISQAFVVVAQKEQALGNLLNANASQADVKDAANAVVNTIKQQISSGALNVKNPQTQATLVALVSTVQGLVNNLLVAYGA